MNEKFNEQKETIIAIKHEINLLYQQIEYLLRNEKPLGLLDLDVLMNRTHTIYDRLCSVNIGDAPTVSPDQEELDPHMMNALFGLQGEEEFEDEEDFIEEEEDEILEENPDVIFEEPVEDMAEEMAQEESFEATPEEPQEELQEESQKDPELEKSQEVVAEEPEPDKHEDYGFIFKLEEPAKTNVYTSGDEIEMTIPHFDMPMAEETPEPEPEIEPEPEPERIPEPEVKSEPEPEEIQYEPVIFGDMEEKEDVGFELEAPETLGDKLQQEEDHTLAAKLQNRSVHDLRSAIGINDKFLLVNELFSGSMEKYNRSIENLDDLKTLNGALIYLNELRIDLQWNSNNEAYKKLLELVHRKFEE